MVVRLPTTSGTHRKQHVWDADVQQFIKSVQCLRARRSLLQTCDRAVSITQAVTVNAVCLDKDRADAETHSGCVEPALHPALHLRCLRRILSYRQLLAASRSLLSNSKAAFAAVFPAVGGFGSSGFHTADWLHVSATDQLQLK
jgi:hypothetical protein